MTDEEAEALAVERFTPYLLKLAIPLWIRRTVPMLDNQRPIDLIKAGKIDDVARQLDEWSYQD